MKFSNFYNTRNSYNPPPSTLFLQYLFLISRSHLRLGLKIALFLSGLPIKIFNDIYFCLHMLRTPAIPWSDHPNNILWRLQLAKLSIAQLSLAFVTSSSETGQFRKWVWSTEGLPQILRASIHCQFLIFGVYCNDEVVRVKTEWIRHQAS
jgi:hypothetical protein